MQWMAFGIAWFWGLQALLSLWKQYRRPPSHKTCSRVVHLPEASLLRIPLLYWGFGFYGTQISLGLHALEYEHAWQQALQLNSLFGVGFSIYCLYYLYFRLQLRCWGCTQVALANGMMALSLFL